MSLNEIDRYTLESEENWRKYNNAMPALELKPGFKFQIPPPFNGALMRFNISYGRWNYSMYFDANGALGIMDEPYWEVYPILDYEITEEGLEDNAETARFFQNEFQEMIDLIYANVEKNIKFVEKNPEFFI
jgi:hypothetical protein